MDIVYDRVGCFHGNQLVCLHYQPHNNNRIQNKKHQCTSCFQNISVVSSLNNACPYPEPALTHLSTQSFVARILPRVQPALSNVQHCWCLEIITRYVTSVLGMSTWYLKGMNKSHLQLHLHHYKLQLLNCC